MWVAVKDHTSLGADQTSTMLCLKRGCRSYIGHLDQATVHIFHLTHVNTPVKRPRREKRGRRLTLAVLAANARCNMSKDNMGQ